MAISWLEKTGKQLGIHIQNALCGHGVKRWILGAPVDGYASKSVTVFQYHGCWWHGCRRCFTDRNTKIAHGKTREELYTATDARTRALRKAGYRVIEKWECDDIKTNERNPQKQTKTYPHAIFYDFESYHDRTKGRANTTVFMKTDAFFFLDIINYLGPGTSYEAWVKAYGCSGQKSWLPYEWLDTPEKLNYPGLPDYPAWYSKLKGCFVLKLSEFKECKKIFKEKGMKTFADWLRYYNNLDVAPGLEALEKMRAFYTEKGIDILKDAVSLPLPLARDDRERRQSV